ncbi:MAG: hypothetical protein EOO87_01600 [Pedobacter sp.]|nr:MAG: hypothetical protein EOO87_01600 [Pedobacter sp.]
MSEKKNNKENNKVEEPVIEYEVQEPKFTGIDHEAFDFDAEFAKGLTSEEFKAEMHKRIKAYPWKK